jgi:GNAT superfamily N-acetyltransferase
MIVDITQVGQSALTEYAGIPIAFEVREVMTVDQDPMPGSRIQLEARTTPTQWIKDYDAVDGGPLSWPTRFDLSHWTFFAARIQRRVIGAAAIVHQAADMPMLAGRDDVALLWDIRVTPDARRGGIGRALREAVEAWARLREIDWLEVETQDINAPACRFYAACRFELRAANRHAYEGLPNETQLLWYKRLSG